MNARLNHLLANLPEAEWQLMAPHLKLVCLTKGQTLFDAGEIAQTVYFPIGALVGMMNDSEDGQSLETFMLGKTCMVGLGAVGQASFYRALVRGSGLAYEMPAKHLSDLRAHCPTYLQNTHAATLQVLRQMSLTQVCSKRHALEQQLIRWMLLTLDRSLDENIQITHQELANITGFRREAVTLNLKKMSERQEIVQHRGMVEVVHRAALEARACACYWIGQQQADAGRARPARIGFGGTGDRHGAG